YNYVNILVIFSQIFVRYRKIEISMLPNLLKFFRKKLKKFFYLDMLEIDNLRIK
ncbi:hypothetical protein CLOHIR_00536, partial [Peptacetobacter hiranonis DSM 13275]